MTPRSSCPGEEYHSSPGRKPPAHYRINTVAENCAGGELAATSPGQARRGRGSATDCLGHFWQADLGHFSRAPKAEPVYLVDQHTIDFTVRDVRQQLSQRRSFQIRSRVSSIIIVFGQGRPARVTLAANIGLCGFPLRLQRVELLVQSFFSRFPAVDRTAQRARLWPTRWRRPLIIAHAAALRCPSSQRRRTHSTARQSPAAPPRSATGRRAPDSESPFPAPPRICSALGTGGSGACQVLADVDRKACFLSARTIPL